MKLSKNFSLDEFTTSNTALRRGIDNEPTPEHIENLKLLCEKVLQPLRDFVDHPIRITSGYRSEALNEAIGGSKTSDHSHGRAADIKLIEDGQNNSVKLFNAIKAFELPFKQLIFEFGTDTQPQWVHVAYEEGNNKKQILRAIKQEGKTKYLTM